MYTYHTWYLTFGKNVRGCLGDLRKMRILKFMKRNAVSHVPYTYMFLLTKGLQNRYSLIKDFRNRIICFLQPNIVTLSG